MKFPTIPHDFPQKTFREVFNRVLNVYLLENDVALISLYQWGKYALSNKKRFCLYREKGLLSGGKSFFFFLAVKEKKGRRYFNHFCL